jgi:excisionase family DNA binding protein
MEKQLIELDSTSRIESFESQTTKTYSNRPMIPQQAAAFLGLDDKTITRWARQGYIPAHPLGEGKRKFWRFFEHELVAWLNAQTNGAAA